MQKNESFLALGRDACLAALLFCVLLSGLAQARMTGQGMHGHQTIGLTINCMDDAGLPATPAGSGEHCDSCVISVGAATFPRLIGVLERPFALEPAIKVCDSGLFPSAFRLFTRSRGPPAFT